jgi:hypothetical protein
MTVIASTLEAVTVYARGARITRVAKLTGTPAPRVRIAGLPLSVIDDSVRVEVVGPAVATSLTVAIDTPATAADAAAEEPADLRAARHRLALADAEGTRLDVALAHLSRAPLVAADPTDEPPAAWDAVLAARVALAGVRAERELALRSALTAASAEHETAQRIVEVLAAREARATSARTAKLHEARKAVDIELTAAGDGDISLRLEYQVRAARWAPSYVARLGVGGAAPGDSAAGGRRGVHDERSARMELRAVVAQSSGEDWLGAQLVLSTAEPAQLSELPELAPQRIGRRQPPPEKRGFRPAPAGAETLYADYDRTRTTPPPPPPAPPPAGGSRRAPSESLADEVWDDGSSRDKEAFSTPPMGNVMPQMQQRPMPVMMAQAAAPAKKSAGILRSRSASPAPGSIAPASSWSDEAKTQRGVAFGGPCGGGGAPARSEPAPPAESATPTSTPRLDYAELRMSPPNAANRGRLAPAPRDPLASTIAHEVTTAAATIFRLTLPRGCADGWAHTYDYAFAADGRVDVASDATWHSLAITAKSATVSLRHVAVPREQADVFRVAAIANPFDGPLLAGPIDIYDRGQFLVTSEVEPTPPGAIVEIGLGVDAQVKVARNTDFREEATGMLRGGLRLVHGIAIDVDNLSPRTVDLEVRERVPVTVAGDEAVEVTVTRAEPAWERWTPDPQAPAEQRLRGAHRWRVTVPPNGKAALRAGYEVKIASKLELLGGNRRES